MIPLITRAPNIYDVRWTSHARGRLGYAADNWLFFAAGGFAVSDLSFQEGAISTTFVPASSGGKYYGWSVGGGVEWAFARNAFARVDISTTTSVTRITSVSSATPIACR